MIIRSPAEGRVLMVGRAAGGQCVYCGDHLDADILRSHGRICAKCLPADSGPVLRMSTAMKVEVPREVDHPFRFKMTNLTIKSSYWLIEKIFGSYPLTGEYRPRR